MDGYYNSLLSFIDKAVDEGFISSSARRIIISAPTAKDLVRQLEVKCSVLTLMLICICSNSLLRLLIRVDLLINSFWTMYLN